MTKVVHLYASQRVSRRAKDGIDGTSVTIISKSVTYQISASGTETPTGNWSDKVVATTDTKPYLWTRTIVVYSDTNSTTSYSVSYKGKDAYRVEASPSTLVFDTNENGVVDGSALSGKYATVTVYKGSQKISVDNLSLPSNYATKKYTNVDGKISNNNGEARITITKIEQEAIRGDEKVSKSSGQISFPIDVLGERSTLMWVTVNVQVNVAKFTGSVVANNKKFETKFTEISKRFEKTPTNDDLAKAETRITQTAREISLSVSEKVIGRRNLLIGSAARRQGEGWTFMSGDYYNGLPCDSIEINSGYDGVNAIHCRTKQTGTNSYYMCGFRWIGTYSSQGNIKIEKGKSYTLSFWAKAYNSSYVNFVSELIWQGSATDNSRPAGYTGPKGFSVTQQATKSNTWTLFKVNIEVPSDASYEYVEVNIFARATNYIFQDAFICKPMLEEGDYNGWTLSEDDYDYVGGNILDNTRSLEKSGNLKTEDSEIINEGYEYAYAVAHSNNTTSTYIEMLQWNMVGRINDRQDYIFSFLAKGTGVVSTYLWKDGTPRFFVESSNNKHDAVSPDGYVDFKLTNEWKRYWVHYHLNTSSEHPLPEKLIIRCYSGNDVYVCQPKLEVGATMTEFTERKTDLVDKASLKAAGIEVTSEKVKLYGDQIEFTHTKSGTAFAMFKDGMLDARLINAAKIIAERLETSGNTGQRVAIEDGLMQIFGTNGVCNIKFGVNDDGEAILSYYDKNGKWLYDLGPNKLDGSQITSSAVTIKEYVKATIKPGTNDFYDNVTYLGKGVKQVKFQYSQLLFGNNRFMNEDDEIKKNSSAHIGYQPFANESNVTKLYRYSAPRMGNTIVKDDKYGLSTADLAKRADGKYFTSMTMASGGSLVNLAPVGVYFGKNEAVRYAPYPNASVGSTNDRFPAFTIGGLEISKVGVGSSIGAYNGFFSYLTRKVSNLNTDIIS